MAYVLTLAGEELAREKRYEFMDMLVSKYRADAVVTAHHKDDVLETAIINISRGTGRRGLSSLKTRQGRSRPLLDLSKQQIIDYAKDNNIEWNVDETNSDSTIESKGSPCCLGVGLSNWITRLLASV
jgi:tRNA(Ile)-lysidine synthase